MISVEEFLQVYGNLLVQTWGDDELKARFLSHPEEVLREFGLDCGNATVELVSPLSEMVEEATPESQVQLWNEGLKTGKIRFIYPENPPEEISSELAEAQLEAVAGGNGYYCTACCCTPCCCC